ncbi:hypothetical protein [Mycobacterium sp. SMC-4]|uniref:hypothetical protein n=1 Tax=Mycobacterium sp. SMC-4 TaxID=2857059 RepID=UPI003D074A14
MTSVTDAGVLDDSVDESHLQSPDSNLPAPPRRRNPKVILACVLPPIGGALIVLSHHHAAGLDEPDNFQFAIYWIGFLSAMFSLVALACSRQIDGLTRACALAGIGLFGMLPRLLHHSPTGSDEFVHLRQAMETFLAGDVGHTLHLLPITKEFFGLHQVISAVAHLSGFPLWLTGLAVVAFAHILSVLAVYQLCRAVGMPAAGAAAGAVLYTMNPSWMYFNVAVSYESLALPLVLWCLAATLATGRATGRPPVRALAAALLCVLVLPTIHHLSTIMLTLILTLIIVVRLGFWFPRAAAGRLSSHDERIWPMALIWFGLLGSIHLWWREKYDWLLNYLGPALAEGFAQLDKILNGVGRTGGQRSLFANSANPVYELVSGYLFPFVNLGIYLWAVLMLWRNRGRIGSASWAFAVLGGMFFASMPMLLTSGGAEGAHRSWGYSFIGLAVTFGMAWSLARTSPSAKRSRLRPLSALFARPAVRMAAIGTIFAVLACGSAALGVNVSHRFPGSAHVGDDARSMSYGGEKVAEWLAAHAPVDTPVMADRYVSSQVGSLGRMSALRPSQRFPIWEIYMNAEPVRPEVLKQIWDSRISYFVVDSRMALTRPKMGTWFTREEPGRGGTKLIPQAALDRFNCLPWLSAVYAAGPLTVYQVDREALARTAAGSCEVSTP